MFSKKRLQKIPIKLLKNLNEVVDFSNNISFSDREHFELNKIVIFRARKATDNNNEKPLHLQLFGVHYGLVVF